VSFSDTVIVFLRDTANLNIIEEVERIKNQIKLKKSINFLDTLQKEIDLFCK